MGIQLKRMKTLVGVACLILTSVSAQSDVNEDDSEVVPAVDLKLTAAQESKSTATSDIFFRLFNTIMLVRSGESKKGDSSPPNTGVGIFNQSNWDEATYE
jgi:hypothetical protein